MVAAAANARRGNHRRTKSTHPDELNKMMLSLSVKEDGATADNKVAEMEEQKWDNTALQEVKRHQYPTMIGYTGGGSFTEGQPLKTG
jgi:hypothetical protein